MHRASDRQGCPAQWHGLVTCYFPSTSNTLFQGPPDVALRAHRLFLASLGLDPTNNNNSHKRRRTGLQAAFDLEFENAPATKENSSSLGDPAIAPPSRGGRGAS